jgi:hypothetical protein
MPIEIGRMKLAPILSLPDVAHHTAAVALTVNTEQQDGKRGNPRSLKMGWRSGLDFIKY